MAEAVGVGVVAHRCGPPSGGWDGRRPPRRLDRRDPRLFNSIRVQSRVDRRMRPVGDDVAVRPPPCSPRCTATSAPGPARTWWPASRSSSSRCPSSWRRRGWPACLPSPASTPSWPGRCSSPSWARTRRCRWAPTRRSHRSSPPGCPRSALTGSARYVGLVGILAVMVGLIVMLVSVLRLGWIAEFLSTPILTGFLSGVAVIIIAHQLPEFFGLPPTTGTQPAPRGLRAHPSQRGQRVVARHRPRRPGRHGGQRAPRPPDSRPR